MDAWVNDYLARCKAALDGLDRKELGRILDLLGQVRRDGGTVFAAGNGGSAATASHFITDLIKLGSPDPDRAFRGLALCDNPALVTAWANDEGYEAVFAAQLRALARSGDVLVAFSTSGRSPNVIRAGEVARSIGVTTVAFTGANGGQLARLADHVIRVPDDHVGRVEDAHLVAAHLICYALAQGSA